MIGDQPRVAHIGDTDILLPVLYARRGEKEGHVGDVHADLGRDQEVVQEVFRAESVTQYETDDVVR